MEMIKRQVERLMLRLAALPSRLLPVRDLGLDKYIEMDARGLSGALTRVELALTIENLKYCSLLHRSETPARLPELVLCRSTKSHQTFGKVSRL